MHCGRIILTVMVHVLLEAHAKCAAHNECTLITPNIKPTLMLHELCKAQTCYLALMVCGLWTDTPDM